MDENMGNCSEKYPGPMTTKGRVDTLTFARRKELMTIAQKVVEQLVASGVKNSEMCFLRRAAEMLVDKDF